MRVIKIVLISLLLLLTIALVGALFVNDGVDIEKTITINAPASDVWNHVSTLKAINTWNPFISKDADMKTMVGGIDGKRGARFCWDSEYKSIGTGCQVITSLSNQEQINIDIHFIKPLAIYAQSSVKLRPVQNSTKTVVTWALSSEIPYPFNLLKIFINPQKRLDSDFTTGLLDLKMMCQNQ